MPLTYGDKTYGDDAPSDGATARSTPAFQRHSTTPQPAKSRLKQLPWEISGDGQTATLCCDSPEHMQELRVMLREAGAMILPSEKALRVTVPSEVLLSWGPPSTTPGGGRGGRVA